jgi:hypothetical protein
MLSHPQAVQDCVKRKCAAMRVILLKIESQFVRFNMLRPKEVKIDPTLDVHLRNRREIQG